ncbi:MAG: hypothetical protein KAX44_08505, partial [Candidatus Brocadiae bacterium]|nr:hypothetical protein [Candidatus Brocadiia bacterium]
MGFDAELYELQKTLSPEQLTGKLAVVLTKGARRREFLCEPQRNAWPAVVRLLKAGWKVAGAAVPKAAVKPAPKPQSKPKPNMPARIDAPLVVGYYTPGYEAEVVKLVQSLDEFGLPHEIDLQPDIGNWKANAHYRPFYLATKRKAYPRRPLLSLDADCMVRADPIKHLSSLVCDIAVHQRNDIYLPGTLWLNPTPGTDALLRRWQYRNQQGPAHYDRRNFTQAIRDLPGLTVAELPPEYCCIYDLTRNDHPGIVPIVEHFQASRTREEGRLPRK